ncbi:MAG: AMIN domain-containing protein [Francisellaceae bacterium]|jgi:N-acetylmuramoyl-L-alanine amidase|nr:AMIN domain-containing protein [Francisellaceae bacterium]
MKLKNLLIMSSILVLVHCARAENIAESIRVWPSPGSIRVVLDLQNTVEYKLLTLSKPDRIVIDIQDIKISKSVVDNIDIKNTMIKKIRVGERGDNSTRLVFELQGPLEPKAFLLKPNEYYGNRLVLDLESREKQSILSLFELDADDALLHGSPRPQAAQEIVVSKGEFVVAIDCGHGGEDPGAIGARGTKEKDVVLAIGKKLRTKINKEPNMRAILTRGGDYYIGLRDRFERARLHHADLFISIHADAFKNKNAHGASVFVLSEKGSTSEAAKWLAEKENRSDLVGGVRLDNKSDILASVLLDLSQTASKKASFDAASTILGSLKNVTKLHKGHVERAGFLVLKAPDVPSLLVETGFISNPSTEKKLRTSSYQDKLASQILIGIKEYYSQHPQHVQKAQMMRHDTTKVYVVKSGDSLLKIAEKFHMSFSELKQLNVLKHNNIIIGQKLKVVKR